MDDVNKKIRLNIGGMTCVNCQDKIEKALNQTDGIISANVSYNNGTADVVYDGNQISRREIIDVIEGLDYEVIQRSKPTEPDITNMICMLVIIVALYIMLQSLGILNLLVPSQLADAGMGYGMLFVIGLITSVHCIAMCGGINLSQSLPQKEHGVSENDSKLAALLPTLAYNLGRVASYTVVGFVFGLIGFLVGGGDQVGLSTLLQGILKIIAGLFMVIMGINMLGIFPALRIFTLRMPRFLVREVGRQSAKTNRPFIIGMLNGFMPCGPLQSMWIVAFASGNPFAGGLSMFLFSLGTVPLMLGLGSVVSALGRRFTDKVMTVGAVLVTVLGLAMLSQGGSLSGWLPPDLLLFFIIAFCIAGVLLSIPVRNKAMKNVVQIASFTVVIGAYFLWNIQGILLQTNSPMDNEMEVIDGVQIVNSTLSSGSYPNITVQAGIPVRWVINAPEGSINGCNYRAIISAYGIEHTFKTGDNVIEFTPTETGTVRYSCWMGMIHGNIFVADSSAGVSVDSIVESGAFVSGEKVSVPTPSGYTIPTDEIAVASLSTAENGSRIQEVTIELTDDGFSPAIIVVQRDLTVYWNIENQQTNLGNGTALLAPYYSTQLSLRAGPNLLILYPTEDFDISTGDNRFFCYVKVVEDLSSVDEESIREEVAGYEPLIYPAEIYESPGRSCC